MNNEVIVLLEELAIRYGTTVEMLWGVLLRQMMLQAVTMSIMGAFLGVLTYFLIKKGISLRQAECAGAQAWSDPPSCAYFIGGGFSGFLVYLTLEGAIFRLINPMYYAIRFILNSGG